MKSYVVITGASSGLGKAISVAYARQGRNLLLISMPNSGLPQLSRQLQEVYHVDVVHFVCDLSSVEMVNCLCKESLQQYDIDCLVNNVGIGGSGSFLEASLSSLYLMIDLNLKASLTLTYSLLPQLLKHRKSQVINVSSIAGVVPVAYKTIYPACKSFIRAFSLSLHEEFKERGVSVSTVFPGPMVTNTHTTERIVKQGFKARLSLCSTTDVAGYILQETSASSLQIVPGIFNRIQFNLAQLLPERLVSKWISRTIKNELVA
ncbi:MAG TPA: SDR family NAD(P)-dependent oxidoreductase [Flavipsychrobacter sp.]|nr:SDR family NAD(P)-dependent oxidoreductase [Flavipsychrobacter sp.]